MLMQALIKNIILSISEDVLNNMPQSFEVVYYSKMAYSDKNTILDFDDKLLKKTIAFEIAFIHVIAYFLACSINNLQKYMHI